MIELGRYNTLSAERVSEFGMYLVDEEKTEVLLPNKLVPKDLNTGDQINVFIYKDHEHRLTATTESPFIQEGEFACLETVAVTKFGAFLDWGLQKHLFCPLSEQKNDMEEGNDYVVFCYIDEVTKRLAASSKIDKYLDNSNLEDLKEGDKVDILVCEPTDIGITVIVNNKHIGLLYNNEVFQRLSLGDEIKAYVKKIREDNKLDITLQKQGYQNVEPNAQKILIALDENDGFMALNDKSEPEDIYAELEMSKKTFKKAIGALYKQKLIEIKETGIQLL